MKDPEYEYLKQAEDVHWWYLGLNDLLKQQRNRLAPAETVYKVLDCGCGTGGSLAKLPINLEKHGIDFSESALKHCRLSHLFNTSRASVMAIPYPDSTFDQVFCLDVLYHRHVPDPASAVAEMARVLKPGGYAYINVPAYEWLRSSHDDHIQTARRFTRQTLSDVITTGGLDVVWMSYWNTALFPAAAGIRLWRRAFPKPGSDIAELPGPATNFICGCALRAERLWLRVLPLPFGLSVFAVARKP